MSGFFTTISTASTTTTITGATPLVPRRSQASGHVFAKQASGTVLAVQHLVAAVLLGRPSPGLVVLAALIAALAGVAWWQMRERISPPVPIEIGDRRPGPDLEPPAVIGLITNGYRVPRTAVVATVIDLIRRGWLRAAHSDQGELVILTRGPTPASDPLRPAEQMVLNHLVANSYEGATSSSILTEAQPRLSGTWLRRFERHIADDARRRGLTIRAWRPIDLVLPVGLTIVGLLIATLASGGTTAGGSITEGWGWRAIWFVTVGVLIVVAWQLLQVALGVAEAPTEEGQRRAGQWIGYRRRLNNLIPTHASVLAGADQQLLLAHGVVLGLAPHVIDEIAVIDDDATIAWSDAGGLAHVVGVSRPRRPGYGLNPMLAVLVGLLVITIAQLIQRTLHSVGDERTVTGLFDAASGVISTVEETLHGIGTAMWLPTLLGVWLVVAGIVDSLWVRTSRGPVIKARRARPGRWVPERLRRERMIMELAVDDGSHTSVHSLVANERTAVPEGVWAQVASTRLLGHIRTVRSTDDGSW